MSGPGNGPRTTFTEGALARAGAALRRVDGELLTIAVLFAALRVFMALFLSPGGQFFRNDGDYQFYRRIAELSTSGFYPYLHYWMEYPPVFPWLVIGLYELSLLVPAWPTSMIWFQIILSTFLGLVDLANLLFVHRLASSLYGRQVGLRAATCYALLFLPAWVVLGWFDTLPLLFLLLALALSGSRRHFLAGVAAGVGLMTKIIPAVAAPSGFLGAGTARRRFYYLAGFALAAGGIGLPLAILNPAMTLASARAMSGRTSWETVWSCYLEDYCGPGFMPSFAERFTAQTATIPFHPETLPWPAITTTLGVLFLWLYTRRLRWQDPLVFVPAVALTLNLLLLFSKGYSPQFLVYPVALLIILKPTLVGALQATLLTALNMIEYPFAVNYGPSSGSFDLLYFTVSVRTALLALLSVEYALMLLRSGPGVSARWQPLANRIVAAVFVIAGCWGVAVGSSMVASQFVVANPAHDVAERVAAFGLRGDAVVASSRDLYYRARPALPGKRWLLADEDGGQWPVALGERLETLVGQTDSVWLMLDLSDPRPDTRAWMREGFDRWGSRATDQTFRDYSLIGYAGYDAPREGVVPLATTFGRSLTAIGRGRLPESLHAGRGLRVEVRFQCDVPPERDLEVFVHLDDENGQTVARRDKPLSWRGQPATQCSPGDALWDASDFLVPSTAAPGLYSVVAGLYDPAAGRRLLITSGGGAGADALRLAGVRVLPPQDE